MLLPPALSATAAAPMRSGSVPNSLVKRMRSALPAMLVCTISRSVESTRVGMVCHGSPPKGDVAQVVTQGADAVSAGVAPWAGLAARRPKAARHANETECKAEKRMLDV